MLIADAHLDLGLNAVFGNRNLLWTAHSIRTAETGQPFQWSGNGTVALPDMRRGRMALSFVTLLARSTGRPAAHIDFDSPEQAYAVAQAHLAYYRALEAGDHCRIITTADQLNQHMAEWEAWDQNQPELTEDTPPLGFVILMESADPIVRPEDVPQWFEQGLRIVGPAHYGPGRYAGGTGTEKGLTAIGRALLTEMAKVGMTLDVTHLTDQALEQALDLFDGPMLASHSNCRTLVPHQRQLTDAQIKLLAGRKAVIGVVLDCWMLEVGWCFDKGSSNAHLTLATVCDHIDHICQLTGTHELVGIGSDLDGGFGREESPSDLDTIADLQKIGGILSTRGYGDEAIQDIMYRNWMRFMQAVL